MTAASNSEPIAPSEAKIKMEHMAAAVVGKNRASRQADVVRLQGIWDKQGEAELFATEAEENIDDKQPNFDESRLVLTSFINNPNANTQRKGRELTTKLNHLQEIAEKRDPGTVEPNALPDAHIQLMGRAIAEIPAVVAAFAKESGLTITAIKQSLEQGTIPQNSSIGRLLGAMAKNERFLSILNKDIGSIEYTEELVGLEADITSREQQITSQQNAINGDRNIYTNVNHTGAYDLIFAMQNNPNNAAAFVGLQRSVNEFNRLQTTFSNQVLQNNQLSRPELKAVDVPQYQQDIDRVIAMKGNMGGQPGLSRAALLANPNALRTITVTMANPNAGRNNAPATIEDPVATNTLKNELISMINAYDDAQKISSIYNANPNFDRDYGNYSLFAEYNKQNGKREELDKRQADLDKETAEMRKLRVRRDKQLNAFGQKVNRVLNKSVKDFYNKTLLGQAQKVAEYEAQQKIDDEKETKDLKEKRGNISESLMKKYLLRTYLKYSGTDVTGWQDDDLKKFVKSDILSTTPGKMGKELIRRIYSMRSSMPPEHKKEIDAMFKEMGVTAGPPPVTAREVIESLDLEKCESMAAEFAPNVMGYAQTRGYYFDRLKMKQPQMDYLLRTYGDDFFAKVIQAKGEYAGEINKMYNKDGEFNDFMDNGVLSTRKIKEVLAGKDWTGGVKRLWKLAGILGTVWFLGGGLASVSAVPGAAAAPFKFDLVRGLTNVGERISSVGTAGLEVAALGSRASGKAISGVTQVVANVAHGAINP